MASSPFLLIIDLRWTVNRRLAEGFQLQEDRALPFNIRLVSSQRYYNLSEALFASGYSGPVVTDLSVVYMALYESGTQTGTYAQNVGVGASLVKSEGFGENPAEIKSLVADNGIQLTETDSEIVIKALFGPTVTDSRRLSPVAFPGTNGLARGLSPVKIPEGSSFVGPGGRHDC